MKTLVGKKTFKSNLIEEGSWGVRELTQQSVESTMELHFERDNTGFIEWDIPALDRSETMGLTFEFDFVGKRTLVDYDGAFSLPRQAIELLEEYGVDCTEMRESLNMPRRGEKDVGED
jgi:hypothetical protein